MNRIFGVVLLGVLLGCSDRHEGNDNIDMIKSERVKSERVADLSRFGMEEMNGFVKRGERLVVGAVHAREGFARYMDLEKAEGDERGESRSVSSSGRSRSLSSFCSFDGVGFSGGGVGRECCRASPVAARAGKP